MTETSCRQACQVPLVHHQPICRAYPYVFRLWEPQELVIFDNSNCFQGWKDNVINIDRVATPVVNTGSTDYISVQNEWFLMYLLIELGILRDWYIYQDANYEKAISGQVDMVCQTYLGGNVTDVTTGYLCRYIKGAEQNP